MAQNHTTERPFPPPTTRLVVEVSAGELIDKITILEIKRCRLRDPEKLAHVALELETLTSARDRIVPQSVELTAMTEELRRINLALWEIEDAIREQERLKDFGPRFVSLARSVYQTNDRRFDVKRRINALLGSRIVETKQHPPYATDAAAGH